MIFGSVCSGIEAASVAWKPLGWRCAFMSEIDKFPRAVLTARHPATPLHGDFTTIRRGCYDDIDVLVGGTPCQSFSVAGLGGGLADDRGNLALEYLRLAARLRPRWLVWENVPGALSKNRGRDFGSILGGLAQLGYGFAYRVLDAQFFRIPQRRRRVFVVGHLGDWRRAAAVLFERESLSGDPPPRRQTGKDAAADPSAGAGDGLLPLMAWGGNRTSGPLDVATAVNAHGGPHGRLDFESETFITHALRGEGFDASEDGSGRGTPLVPVAFSSKDHGADAGELAPTLRAMGHDRSHANAGGQLAVALAENQRGEVREMEVSPALTSGGGKPGPGYPAVAVSLRGREGGGMAELSGEVSPALRASQGGGDKAHLLDADLTVRRLTPRECERLQGFPDDYTLVAYRGRPPERCPDGPRYKAVGNSMPVPVMRWLGTRIEMAGAL